ncbi:MAG: hypothetical protein LBI68_01230 [Azoarcus sp.]|jgi:hypothetical protein|nr:hypothetical protein [Azoarcus sp.]
MFGFLDGFFDFGKNKVHCIPAVTVNETMPSSPIKAARAYRAADNPAPDTSALNSQIVQAVQFSNSETAAHASEQIAVPPDMMIAQASGLSAQSAAGYFDGVSKLALASKSVLLKQMTENIGAQKMVQAGEDALGALVTDLLVGSAAAIAAAAGVMKAESVSFAIDKIKQSIESYSSLLGDKSKTTEK